MIEEESNTLTMMLTFSNFESPSKLKVAAAGEATATEAFHN